MNPLTSILGTIISGFVLAIIIVFALGTTEFDLWSTTVWLHVLAGVVWIGLLYYFNFVQVPAVATALSEADSGGPGPAAINKYVAPRALLWFRWAAVATWLTGALALEAAGRVDGKRLLISGGSAGGYTVLCALTFTEAFTAGASHYGIGDLESMFETTHKFESRYDHWLIGPYPEARELYRERSPLHHADRISSPVIFFQGLDDPVVPPAQAETMVKALREALDGLREGRLEPTQVLPGLNELEPVRLWSWISLHAAALGRAGALDGRAAVLVALVGEVGSRGDLALFFRAAGHEGQAHGQGQSEEEGRASDGHGFTSRPAGLWFYAGRARQGSV